MDDWRRYTHDCNRCRVDRNDRKEVETLSLGENIKTRRKEKGLSQEELAERVLVSTPMICQIERGTRNPSLQLGKAIADVLGCTVDELLSKSPIFEQK